MTFCVCPCGKFAILVEEEVNCGTYNFLLSWWISFSWGKIVRNGLYFHYFTTDLVNVPSFLLTRWRKIDQREKCRDVGVFPDVSGNPPTLFWHRRILRGGPDWPQILMILGIKLHPWRQIHIQMPGGLHLPLFVKVQSDLIMGYGSKLISMWCCGPLTRNVKLWVANALGKPGMFSPPPTSKETAR